MADDDGMNGILRRQFGIAEVLRLDLRIPVARLLAEGMAAGMHGAQAGQHLFHAVGQRLPGRAGAGEQGVAAVGRDLDRDQDGAKRRRLVIAVVGVPAAADIVLLVRLLQHGRDFGMGLGRPEEAVDVDLDLAREGDLGVRVQRLVAEEQHAVAPQRQPDRRRLIRPDGPQVDIVDEGPDPAAGGRNVEAVEILRVVHAVPFGSMQFMPELKIPKRKDHS